MSREEVLPIAKQVYKEIELAIQAVMEEYEVSIGLLEYIEINGIYFHVDELKD